jgi:hypothetical protein
MTGGTREKESASRAIESQELLKDSTEANHLDSSGKGCQRYFPLIRVMERIKAAERVSPAGSGVCVSRMDRSPNLQLGCREGGGRKDGQSRLPPKIRLWVVGS